MRQSHETFEVNQPQRRDAFGPILNAIIDASVCEGDTQLKQVFAGQVRVDLGAP